MLELSILIPTYNEADIIVSTLQAIARELGPALSSSTEILVADDGTDALPETVAKAAPALGFAHVEVLRNSPPLGKGLSLARGFQNARGKIVGFLDADLSTPPSYIRVAVEAIRDQGADIFIGSRRTSESKVQREQSQIKEVLGTVLSTTINAFIFQGGKRYEDTQCGFKFFKNGLAKLLYSDLVAYDGMTDIEVLVRANLLDLKVIERGVEWTDVRESKRALHRIIVGDLKAITRIVLNYRLFSGERVRKLKLAAEKLH